MGDRVESSAVSHGPGGGCAAGSSPRVTPDELQELLSAFNEVTGKLHASHEALQQRVARLQAELSEANEQLHRSRRLAALGEMAAGIAHEIRNPLASIGLYARMLDEDLEGQEEPQATARKIRASVRGVERIVRDVLAFAREMRLQCEREEVGSLLEEALAGVPIPAGVEVRVEAGLVCDEGAIDCDRTLVVQAVSNLVRNALDAMESCERGGHVLVLSARRERVGGEDRAVLGVSDTGPGIPAEVVDRMFNPFFTTRAAGTGLGLAIVHRIVDAHGGSVRVRNRSEDGEGRRGACVELVLPIRGEEIHSSGVRVVTRAPEEQAA